MARTAKPRPRAKGKVANLVDDGVANGGSGTRNRPDVTLPPIVFQVTVSPGIHPELFRALRAFNGKKRSMVIQAWADRGRVASWDVILSSVTVGPTALVAGHQLTLSGVADSKGDGDRGTQSGSPQMVCTYSDVADTLGDLNLFDD